MILNTTLLAAFHHLQSSGLRLTRPRRAIVDALYAQSHAVTAADLHDVLADRGVSLATVYRTLETLADLGLAETVVHSDNERRYVACSLDRHHHHLICTCCGRVERLDECIIGPLQALVEERTDFKIDQHVLEFQGRCASCRD